MVLLWLVHRGNPSAFQAVLMFVLWLVSQICGREYDRWSALSFAGMLVSFGQPMQLFVRISADHAFGGRVKSCIRWLTGNSLSRREKTALRMVEKLWKRLGPGVIIQLITCPVSCISFRSLLCGLFLNLLISASSSRSVVLSGQQELLLPVFPFREDVCFWHQPIIF